MIENDIFAPSYTNRRAYVYDSLYFRNVYAIA